MAIATVQKGASLALDPVAERERRRVATKLVAAGDKIRSIQQMLILAEDERWNLIQEGVNLGIRKAEIARHLKISDGRVHQIFKERQTTNGKQGIRRSRKAQ